MNITKYQPAKVDTVGVITTIDEIRGIFVSLEDIEIIEGGLIRFRSYHQKNIANLFQDGAWIPYDEFINTSIIVRPSLVDPIYEVQKVPEWVGRSKTEAETINEENENKRIEKAGWRFWKW